MPNKADLPFIELVQNHERAWGKTAYPNRPTLAQLLAAPIVAWWLPAKAEDTRLMATTHDTLDALNVYATRLIVYSRVAMPDKRLVMLHINQRKAAVRGVTLHVVGLDPDA